jgi:hypothetical protein
MDKLTHNSKHLELNEVTHYSKWIEKFLKNQIKTKTRTNQDNNQEYNDDKWGSLLARIDTKNITIKTADEFYYGDETTVCIVENKNCIIPAL